MRLSAIKLADIHLELLYETDERGLILRSRDPDVVAPLVHLVRTVEGNRWLIAASSDARELSLLHDALAAEPVVPSLEALESMPPLLAGVREALGITHPESDLYRGPAFSFPDDLPSSHEGVEVLQDAASAPTVPELAWIRSTGERERPLCVARNEAGEIVAVCHSARSTGLATEAGVETASGYRGQGLATTVVARWAAVVRADGRVPVYSTSWANLASRAVARRLRLEMFGEDVSLG